MPDLARGDRVEVADDHAEQVVEVVRQAAGQLAHRLDPLRVAELLLHLHALRDVTHRSDDDRAVGRLVRAQNSISIGNSVPSFRSRVSNQRPCRGRGARMKAASGRSGPSGARWHQQIERPTTISSGV